MDDWKHGLCSCFDNVGLCLVTFLAPCHTAGKNAEALGDDCRLCGLIYLVPVVNVIIAAYNRGRTRRKRGIAGTSLGDLCTSLLCPCCSLIQEAKEHQEYGQMFMARA